ncbi:Panacea domain-containing protein [Gloeobacter violaceus]|uniref:Glr3897 protein n=1 Tax=Gloeobacter violaceus (strain ATCC 29082 / PCC 7421) TaxID=251221 RepID=Q7NEI2_GLOVI|nr:type II toxin-antitoxin system antitoxin SocA domain-containing protein [Gloeobacter violaceus]BAC91838.1 glr3897 [Gloeobacter violaceus PCC 7421]
MGTADDAAAYILNKLGAITAMKLQKLLYYSQAWSLVWDDHPLFDERIEAWANGPVIPAIYEQHRGQYLVTEWLAGNPGNLGSDAIETIDAVLKVYGDKSSQWLSDLTHKEAPWRDARLGIPTGVPCKQEITQASMAEYYGSL